MSPAMRAALGNLAVDRTTGEVVRALAGSGIRSILLKGPAIVRWLYDEGEVRSYCDCDLLVGPEDWSAAESILERMGFQPGPREIVWGDWPIHARVWWRPGAVGGVIDLHQTLSGAQADVASVWAVLSAHTETMEVAGTEVEVLQPEARALALVLHAAKDGFRVGKVRNDLDHALQRLEPSVWEEAAVLADRLGAGGAFATGLRFLPAGEALADRLRLTREQPVLVALRARGAPAMSVWLLWLGAERRWLRKIDLIARKLVPPPDYLRDWQPLARRGKAGLVAAYLWRPAWMLWRLGPAVRAVRRAKVEAGALYSAEPPG